MRFFSGTRRIFKLSLAPAIAVAMIAFGFIAEPASAATNSSSSSAAPIAAVHAKMTLNCTTMPQKAHDYAVAHGYCPKATGGVAPNAVAYGNCGDSWIYIWDVTGGDADISYGFDSSLGPVAYRNLGIGYSGPDASGGWNDSGWMLASSYTSGRSNLWVGRYGEAYATFGGSVTLAWGGTCTLLEPTDWTYMGD